MRADGLELDDEPPAGRERRGRVRSDMRARWRSEKREGLSRRELLALGALALPAGLVLQRGAAAQEFQQISIPPDSARLDPLDARAQRRRGAPAAEARR